MKNIMKFAAVILLTVLVSAGLSMTAYGTEEGNGASLISGRLNLREGTIADGLSIRGEALTGQQPDAAKEAVYAPIEKLMGSEVHMKSDKNPDHLWGTTVVSLGVKWDKDTIENAIDASIVPGGRVLDRYKFAADHRAAPQDLDYGIQIDENHIYGFFTEKLAAWNCDPVEATFTARAGTVTEYTQMGASREVIVTPGSNGYSYDFRNCVHEFVENVKALKTDDSDIITLTPDVVEVEPNMTTEHAQSMSVIGYCTTEYSVPRTQQLINREQNLKVGIQRLDGLVFQPGEQISALAIYGDVMDPANGYAKAGTYTTAGHGDEMGGGLCQVTTTLYNAVLEAELNVIYRHQHSFMISYVEPSLDAMVYPQGGSDFIFENSSSDIIKLEGCVDLVNQWIHIWIIGHEDHDPGHRVEYVSVIDGINKATVTCVPDASLPIGWASRKFYATADAQHGVNSHLIKRVYEGDTLVSEEFLHSDIYKAMAGVVHCSPDCTVDTIITDSLKDYFTTLDTRFINQVWLGDNPSFWTPEKRAAFNADMSARMEAMGYTWPDSGSSFSFDGEVKIPNEIEPSTEPDDDDDETTAPGKKDDDDKPKPSEKPSEKPEETTTSEAPASEAPASEAPASEAPASEAPASEAPASEAPAAEAPAEEAAD